MNSDIKKVVVLGAGTMGAQVAAHVVAQDIEVVLLDVPSPPPDKNAAAKRGLAMLGKLKPSPLHLAEHASRLRIGNFEDDLGELKNADWVFEAIVEDLDIKKQLWARVAEAAPKRAVLSSNTSGLGIGAMSAQLAPDARKRFLGTHFFNPPRYLKLLETIPGPETDPALLARIEAFCDEVLGKSIVRCKDTPDFIANRIGAYSFAIAVRAMVELDLTIEEVEALTGPVLRRPKSATFRTADLAGIDVLLKVCATVYHGAPHDPERAMFELPGFVKALVERKSLGVKTGTGFYRKDGDKIQTLDWKTLEYREWREPEIATLAAARGDLATRIATLLAGNDKYARFVERTLSLTSLYAASLVPEIADDVVSIDRALEWGYGWGDGPFKLLDALGVERTVQWAQKSGRPVPPIIERMLASGRKRFFEADAEKTTVFLTAAGPAAIPARRGVIELSAIKSKSGAVVQRNPSASLVDIGDGIGLVEFHSKMNTIDDGTFAMIGFALTEGRKRFDAVVIGNQGENFCAGANLMLIVGAAMQGKWDDIGAMVKRMQDLGMAMKYGGMPVVVAPFGLALGGGCEIALHGSRVRMSAETYTGLVEVGVGLVPAGGGSKEMALRALDRCAGVEGVDPAAFLRRAFETIAFAKVSTSGAEAKRMYFADTDSISPNPDRLLEDAKQVALALVRTSWRSTRPRADIPALGKPTIALFEMVIHNMKRGGFISDHDALIGKKVATILCGGDRAPGIASEQQFLDLEREAFLSLLGMPKTHERIKHMLEKGKPLRN